MEEIRKVKPFGAGDLGEVMTLLEGSEIPAEVGHEFACRCAERLLARVKAPDTRSLEAVRIKRAWVREEVSSGELFEAWRAANAAEADALRKEEVCREGILAAWAASSAADSDARSSAWLAARILAVAVEGTATVEAERAWMADTLQALLASAR